MLSSALLARVVFAGVVFACLGAVAGWGASRALRQTRRPAVVPVGWCAAGTALLWMVVGLRWVWEALPGWWLPVPLAATALAVPLTAADLAHRRLPDVLTLPAYPLAAAAVGAAALARDDAVLAGRAALGAVTFFAAHALVRAVAASALGGGDVKLSGSLGALLGAAGWAALVLGAVTAALGTALLAGWAALTRNRRWRMGVPHGPGLLVATCLLVLFPGHGLFSGHESGLEPGPWQAAAGHMTGSLPCCAG